ncbi:DUF7352 domain-containing protein [Marinospirillum alkaliphilum]|uniref:DUF7352 domain-containing protein n=1 Tax=Marinospirillum alkaliphilum DSM 21637 TaxID=1122209 RepID=A0A1K1X070_9GAMM|nr:hypothetical protein [Marinospirillum alkaliphilum]SFX43034.1 hypothetical protein SAMN02745752_01635 [Marinospirillum alkaliphilum DSM 21637]
MKTVHKFRLECGGALNSLKLRKGFRLVHSEYLVTEKAVFVWIEVPLDLSLPEVQLKLRVFRTGEAIPRNFSYLSSAVDGFGPEAYHIYSLEAQDLVMGQVA